MHKITNLWKFVLNWSLNSQEDKERQDTRILQMCVLSAEVFYYFLKNNVTSEEPFLTMFYIINSSPLIAK